MGSVTLLADPEPRPARYTIVSVDDHLIEPPDLFAGRIPAPLAGGAPRVIEGEDGSQAWLYEDKLYPNIGLNAVAGRPIEEWSMEPARFDQMRRGCWDIHARIRDMDLAGIWASVCFPSLIAGFAGSVFSQSRDQALGLACVRAWNDWHAEVWAGSYPQRIIPLQIPWLSDPEVAAEEVRRNAARGFRALSFPENPAHLGLASMHSGHWDPLLRACEQTQTVICLHTGSSFWTPVSSPGAPLEEITTLFSVNALVCAADWLWSLVPVRFPEIRIAMSEGGIGWVPMLLDRLDYVMTHSAQGENAWHGTDLSPSQVLQRNFWFCTIDDPSLVPLRHRIGVDRIMVDVDFPHADTTWPDTQLLVEQRFGALPDDEIRAITCENAARLFRFPLP
ncbi:MAG: amidohydrolase [Chloroflexi bacterium]|nr:MAG: amidohydrolase [Chloroflexota bacterium]